jgi:hypothetical protein
MSRNDQPKPGPTSDVDQPGEPPSDEGNTLGNEWPPLRLGAMPPAVPFPVDVLPVELSDFVRVVSDAIGCPPDFVAVSLLVVAGATAALSVVLQLKPGYRATAGLYAMTVGGPSSGKTPALKAVLDPIHEIDNKLCESYQLLMAHYLDQMEEHKNAPAASKPPLPTRPVPEAVVVGDVTTEVLAYLLSQNPRGMLMTLDEGTALVRSLGQYKDGKGADKQFYMSALYGTKIRQDRRGRPDEPLIIPEPFLAIQGNLTPDSLAEFRAERGRQDGFLERILFTVPEARPKPPWSEEGIPDEVAAAWAGIVGRLRGRSMQKFNFGSQPHVITFNDEAKAAWIAWHNSHVALMNSDSPDAGDPAAEWKLCDFAARLALILHLLHVAADPATKPLDAIPPVSLAAVEGAIRLWAYFRSNERRVRSAMAGRGLAGAPRRTALILGWIRNDPARSTFNQGELTKCYAPSRAYDPDEMEDALKWLTDRHGIRPIGPTARLKGQRGRRPSQAWEVHPDLILVPDQTDTQGVPTALDEGECEGSFADYAESPDIPEDRALDADQIETPEASAA